MYEIVIEPENGGESCYTQLPFVPHRGAEVTVERWRRRTRTFLLTTEAQINVRHVPDEEPRIAVSFGALEHPA